MIRRSVLYAEKRTAYDDAAGNTSSGEKFRARRRREVTRPRLLLVLKIFQETTKMERCDGFLVYRKPVYRVFQYLDTPGVIFCVKLVVGVRSSDRAGRGAGWQLTWESNVFQRAAARPAAPRERHVSPVRESADGVSRRCRAHVTLCKHVHEVS
ncbi:hypothetical protein EVAR_29673_1 [Eumeta japonica]|uniref:Uncharacterized protein n=1 Tax=Eumeta variegata TaxID=151549 RepID=A0A4C1W839_EUMVA|nr:hypothetical protein EVAR_29673_1 [Eumeta japonica]